MRDGGRCRTPTARTIEGQEVAAARERAEEPKREDLADGERHRGEEPGNAGMGRPDFELKGTKARV
jgi:hypothetical protein